MEISTDAVSSLSGLRSSSKYLLENAKFTVLDYCLFGAMLILSGLTGLYFAYRSRSRTTDVQDYLMGSRKMKTFPVAMSLIGSYVSGITIVGTPAEIYNFGTQYWLIIIAILLSGVIVAFVYLPVYFNLQLKSSYEYLELRFDRSLRMLASIMFLFDEIMFLPVVIYVPALAFNQVTGINIYIVGSSVCILCIFYTVLGGLKAVVWTDTWQVAIMFGSVLLFAIAGTVSAGGFGNVFRNAYDKNLLNFWNWGQDSFQRHTAMAVLIGGTMYWTAFNSINMTMVQRYMSLPTKDKAVRSVFLFSVSATFIISLCCYTGLLIFEKLGSCNPLTAGWLDSDDQLLPAYTALIAKNIPGALGIFIAGIFGAALSSLSVVLNSTATVVLEDLICGFMKKTPSPMAASAIARITATVLGLVSLAMLFVVEHLGGVLNVATSLSAIAASSMFGVFTLGMLWPWATSRGALVGALSGALLGSWVSMGSQASAQNFVPSDKREPDMSGCPQSLNFTIPSRNDSSHVFPLYKLSYHWIAPIGICTTILVGIVVSFFTKEKDYQTLDPNLFSPVIYRWLPEKMLKNAGISSRREKLEDNAGSPNDLLLAKLSNQEQPKSATSSQKS